MNAAGIFAFSVPKQRAAKATFVSNPWAGRDVLRTTVDRFAELPRGRRFASISRLPDADMAKFKKLLF